jgi:hypothetical protein
MDYNKIRALLEKYWEAATSLEEEAQLRNFFVTHQHALPEDLREAAPLFRYFQLENERDIPAMPEARIIPMTKSRPWQHWMKYAAMLLIMAGIGFGVQQSRDKHKQLIAAEFGEDTYNDPEVAYKETQKALELLARNLNKGTAQMEKLSYFNEATEKIKAASY